MMTEAKEKFECADCGCFYWVKDRDNFDCPNCEQKIKEAKLYSHVSEFMKKIKTL